MRRKDSHDLTYPAKGRKRNAGNLISKKGYIKTKDIVKIFGIFLTKNEGDIMEYSLLDKIKWCEKIFVFDNGSSDDSWETVLRMSKEHRKIIPFKRESVPFFDHLRSQPFNEYRHLAKEGDWWCRLDTDEFYIDSPEEFLAQIPKHYHVVWSAHLQYYITEKDIERYPAPYPEKAPKFTGEVLPRYYKANFSEPRFFRHRDRLKWPSTISWPEHMGLIYPKRIRIKHYQYRSPSQIQIRLKTRQQAANTGYVNFKASLKSRWEEKIFSSEGLHLDTGDGKYVINESELGSFRETPGKYLIKRFMHGAGIWP